MRLIDATELEREWEKIKAKDQYNGGGYLYSPQDLLDSIEEAETIETEPEKHGKWEEWWPPKHMILTGEEMLYRCSVCDAKYSDKENMRYCPNCGARMDGAE